MCLFSEMAQWVKKSVQRFVKEISHLTGCTVKLFNQLEASIWRSHLLVHYTYSGPKRMMSLIYTKYTHTHTVQSSSLILDIDM